MSDKAEAAVAIFAKQIGKSDSISEWIEVDQKRLQRSPKRGISSTKLHGLKFTSS